MFKRIGIEAAKTAMEIADRLPKGAVRSVPSEVPFSEHKKYYRLEVPSYKYSFNINYYFERGESDVTLVFFHGLGSSEDDLVNPGFFSAPEYLELPLLYDLKPNILSVSFGWSWLLVQKKTQYPQYQTPEVFVDVLTHLETKFGLFSGKRILMGRSMGGANAIQMWMRFPDMWDLALFHVPMVIQCNPYNWFDMKCLAAPIIRGHVKQAEYPAYNPFNRGDLLGSHLAPAQFQVSQKDGFNLYQSGLAMAGLAKSRGVLAEVVENPGGHGDFNAAAAARFLNQIL